MTPPQHQGLQSLFVDEQLVTYTLHWLTGCIDSIPLALSMIRNLHNGAISLPHVVPKMILQTHISFQDVVQQQKPD